MIREKSFYGIHYTDKSLKVWEVTKARIQKDKELNLNVDRYLEYFYDIESVIYELDC